MALQNFNQIQFNPYLLMFVFNLKDVPTQTKLLEINTAILGGLTIKQEATKSACCHLKCNWNIFNDVMAANT